MQAGAGGAQKNDFDALLLYPESRRRGRCRRCLRNWPNARERTEALRCSSRPLLPDLPLQVGDDLAPCYLDLIIGRGIAKDEKTGTDYLTAAVALGNVLAQQTLGVFYLEGLHGLMQNDIAGRLHTESAAINGDDDAQIDYGVMLLDGARGAKQDHDAGMALILKAARTNDCAAKVTMQRAQR